MNSLLADDLADITMTGSNARVAGQRLRLDIRPSFLHDSPVFGPRLNPETASLAQSAKSDFLSIITL